MTCFVCRNELLNQDLQAATRVGASHHKKAPLYKNQTVNSVEAKKKTGTQKQGKQNEQDNILTSGDRIHEHE